MIRCMCEREKERGQMTTRQRKNERMERRERKSEKANVC